MIWIYIGTPVVFLLAFLFEQVMSPYDKPKLPEIKDSAFDL